MRHAALWMSIALGVSAIHACADGSANTPSSRGQDNSVVRLDTPEGRAIIKLVLNKRSVSSGGQLRVRLVNRGDVPVLTGLAIRDERWNGERWVEIEREGIWAWPLIGITLKPGRRTQAQTWPFGGISEPEPGLYRLTKSATYEGSPALGRDDRKLVATATFEVTI